MKKFTLLLASLFLALGISKAQRVTVTDLNELDSSKVYILQSARCFLLYSDKVPGEIATSNGTKVGTVAFDYKNTNQHFKIEKDGDNYYLFSVGAGNYVTSNGSYSKTRNGALQISSEDNADYPWKLCIGGNGMNSQESGKMEAGIVVNGWTTADAGNRYRIIDAEASKFCPNDFSEFDQNKCYTVTTKQRGGWAVNNGDEFVSTKQAGEVAEDNKKFAVLSADGVNYYLYSVGAKGFVKKQKDTTIGIVVEKKGDALAIKDASTEGFERIFVSFKGLADGYINLNGESNMDICTWSYTDHGNAVLFIEAGDFDPTEALAMLNNAATEVEITYNFTYNSEVKYTQTTSAFVGEEYPNITVAFPFGITATKPAGTIAADAATTVTIALEENLPFAYYPSYGAIEKWYYVKLKGANYLYHEDRKDHIALDKSAVDATNKDAFSWAFVGDPFNGYQFVNKAAGEGKILSSTTNTKDGDTGAKTWPVMTTTPVPDGNNELWYLTASTYQANGFYMEQKGHSANKMNDRGKLAYWNSGADNGSTFTVEERPSAIAALTALVAQAETLLAQINMGDAIGLYSCSYEGYEAAYAEILAYVEGGEIEEAVAEDYVLTLSEIIASFSVNGLEAGKYYTLRNGDYYITSDVTEETVGKRIACSETNDAKAIYYFDGEHLLAYKTGRYFGLNESDWTFEAVGSTDISTITFAAVNGGTANVLNICSGGRWLHRTDGYINRCQNNTCGDLHNWTIAEVTALPVTVTEVGYATFYAPVAVTVDNGVTAYTVTVDGKVAKLNEIGTTIHANTGVVLVGAGDYNFAITTAAAFDGENDLLGTAAATNVTSEAYVLSAPDGKVGFYTATMEDGSWLNNSHKAYLPKSQATNAPYYSFSFEGTTGIENVVTEGEGAVIYDLQGRRVENPVRGIYIVNGNKVLVK